MFFLAAVPAGLAMTVLAMAVQAQTAAPNGETLFKQRCAMCHAVAAGKPSSAGPNLYGVVGRVSGTGARFNYSPALKRAGIKWEAKNLNAFLAAPSKLVPGTRMITAIPDANHRAAVVGYLARQK